MCLTLRCSKAAIVPTDFVIFEPAASSAEFLIFWALRGSTVNSGVTFAPVFSLMV